MEPVETSADRIREQIRDSYGKIAATAASCCGTKPSCCGSSPVAAAELVRQIGYSAEELAALPEGSNLGLSCGNPNALAALQPGEVVLDLGAGGGFDVFIAARKVGPTGRAIGVDMTPEMLAKARNNLTGFRRDTGLDNVEFRLGEIEHLPLADHSVDVVISNCVINLSPDKPQVWREIARVLRPGGRVAVSDLALLQPLPAEVLTMVEALVGCVAGAVLVSETERMAREAGLTDLVLDPKPQYVEAMTNFEDPLYQQIVALLPPGARPADYLASLEVRACKPASVEGRGEGLPPTKTVLEVFDPAMCCSTGVCGPQVDPALVRFAADLKWVQDQGVEVRRFNLSQDPLPFVENELVRTTLHERGESALPMLLIDGQVAASGRYPGRDELVKALGRKEIAAGIFTPPVAELVAIGAAVAAHCEPCLKHHHDLANKLGVSKSDMAQAVRMAAAVKDAAHRSIVRLADRLTGQGQSQPLRSFDLRLPDLATGAEAGGCCEAGGAGASTGKCC
jgi:AhpD family alkylhydroperoxidase